MSMVNWLEVIISPKMGSPLYKRLFLFLVPFVLIYKIFKDRLYHWKGFESYPNLRKLISRYVPHFSVTDVLLLFHHRLKFCYLFSHLVKSFFLSCPSEIWPECWHIGDKHSNKQFWKLNGTSTRKEGHTFLLSVDSAPHLPNARYYRQSLYLSLRGRQALSLY
jgi:hypothetical protein